MYMYFFNFLLKMVLSMVVPLNSVFLLNNNQSTLSVKAIVYTCDLITTAIYSVSVNGSK